MTSWRKLNLKDAHATGAIPKRHIFSLIRAYSHLNKTRRETQQASKGLWQKRALLPPYLRARFFVGGQTNTLGQFQHLTESYRIF